METTTIGGIAVPISNYQYIPHADIMEVPANGLYMDIFFGVFFVIVFAWMIYLVVKNHDIVPLLLFIGGMLMTGNEAIVDVLGQVVYPLNYTHYLISFGRVIPLWLFSPYGGFLSIMTYYIAKEMEKLHPSKKLLYGLPIGMFIGVFCLDWFVVHVMDAYYYAGSGFGNTMLGSIEMAAFTVISGYLLMLMRKRKNPAFKLTALIIPYISFTAGLGLTFPLAFAMNTELPLVFDVLYRSLSFIEVAFVVWLVVDLLIKSKDAESGHAKLSEPGCDSVNQD